MTTLRNRNVSFANSLGVFHGGFSTESDAPSKTFICVILYIGASVKIDIDSN